MGAQILLAVGLAAIFVALVLALATVGVFSTERADVARTLATVDSFGTGARPLVPDTAGFGDRVLDPFFHRMAAVGRRLSPAEMPKRKQRHLDLAGNPPGWTVEKVLAYKAIGLIGLLVLGLLIGKNYGLLLALLFGAVGGAAGFFLPDVLLYNIGIKRQQKIQKDLPDSLDLLVISVQAGLGFDAALSRVAKNTKGPLGQEFFRVLQEMQIGKSRTDAFRALLDRTDVPELRTFITALVQADAFGIPIARVLAEQAKEMRVKRHQRAEEMAQKVPVKILFPLVFFILPALFVVIIGPGALSIVKTFSGS